MTFLLALDQGTSSSRAMVFATDGRIVGMAQQPFRQIYPRPGWVEHDPLDIWSTTQATLTAALQQSGLTLAQISAIGITNQRETTLVWHRKTGVPLFNALVWQDRRTDPLCRALRDSGWAPRIADKTGLCLDPYFSATKLRWVLDNVPDARRLANAGELAFGTVDTWLIWQLTHGTRHVTDVSNASRTMLFNIHTGQWDDELLACFDIPRALLPEVLPSAADFGTALGTIPIGGVAGDQQAALFGQGCLHKGQVKNTYGTGCFMLMHCGEDATPSHNGLITTRTAQTDATPGYALEGSVFIAGALVQWLRDELGIINTSADIETLACQVPDSAGVVIVPAFAGLGAPYWRADARGSIQGLTRGSNRAHLARAALESIALQSTALFQAMQRDSHQAVAEMRVDGGACVNDTLMQIQADLLQIPVVRPDNIETTALGAALLAGLSAGVYESAQALASATQAERIFEPQKPADWAEEKMATWARAVAQSAAPDGGENSNEG